MACESVDAPNRDRRVLFCFCFEIGFWPIVKLTLNLSCSPGCLWIVGPPTQPPKYCLYRHVCAFMPSIILHVQELKVGHGHCHPCVYFCFFFPPYYYSPRFQRFYFDKYSDIFSDFFFKFIGVVTPLLGRKESLCYVWACQPLSFFCLQYSLIFASPPMGRGFPGYFHKNANY